MTLLQESVREAQTEFDRKFITSSEVCERLRVTRVAIHIRRKNGKLPNAIVIGPALVTLWERDDIEPFLQEWQEHLTKRRSAVG